jgi:hypothetical protein
MYRWTSVWRFEVCRLQVASSKLQIGWLKKIQVDRSFLDRLSPFIASFWSCSGHLFLLFCYCVVLNCFHGYMVYESLRGRILLLWRQWIVAATIDSMWVVPTPHNIPCSSFTTSPILTVTVTAAFLIQLTMNHMNKQETKGIQGNHLLHFYIQALHHSKPPMGWVCCGTVTLLLSHIRDILSSNLGLEISYSNSGFSRFYSVSPGM